MNNTNKTNRTVKSFILALGLATAGAVFANVPLNNLQGTGGVAFNPLAYTSGLPWETEETNSLDIVSKPQVGTWYAYLDDSGISWSAASVAFSVFDRVEVSGGYGLIDAYKYGDSSINTYNLGAKLRFLDENAFDQAWVPALAAGGVYKYTDARTVKALGLDNDGFDIYVVASKLITQTPVPVLLSGGVLISDEVVNGVVGHNDYDVVGFGNVDIIPVENVAFGVEYKQGVNAGDGIRNHDYYDVHAAWFATPKLTFVGAFVATGDKDKFYRHGSAKDLGVGSGLVLSAQYQF